MNAGALDEIVRRSLAYAPDRIFTRLKAEVVAEIKQMFGQVCDVLDAAGTTQPGGFALSEVTVKLGFSSKGRVRLRGRGRH
jgi:hypothetical protein